MRIECPAAAHVCGLCLGKAGPAQPSLHGEDTAGPALAHQAGGSSELGAPAPPHPMDLVLTPGALHPV